MAGVKEKIGIMAKKSKRHPKISSNTSVCTRIHCLQCLVHLLTRMPVSSWLGTVACTWQAKIGFSSCATDANKQEPCEHWSSNREKQTAAAVARSTVYVRSGRMRAAAVPTKKSMADTAATPTIWISSSFQQCTFLPFKATFAYAVGAFTNIHASPLSAIFFFGDRTYFLNVQDGY